MLRVPDCTASLCRRQGMKPARAAADRRMRLSARSRSSPRAGRARRAPDPCRAYASYGAGPQLREQRYPHRSRVAGEPLARSSGPLPVSAASSSQIESAPVATMQKSACRTTRRLLASVRVREKLDLDDDWPLTCVPIRHSAEPRFDRARLPVLADCGSVALARDATAARQTRGAPRRRRDPMLIERSLGEDLLALGVAVVMQPWCRPARLNVCRTARWRSPAVRRPRAARPVRGRSPGPPPGGGRFRSRLRSWPDS
jgi:hypothetical protein